MLPLWAKVDPGAMALKGYSAFPKAPAFLEPQHQIVSCHVQDTRSEGGDLISLQRSSRYIQHTQGHAEYIKKNKERLIIAAITAMPKK